LAAESADILRDEAGRWRSSLISQTHCDPFGNFGTGKQSIGSTKAALVLGSERSGSAGIGRES
jgi:hypothetical protein